MTPELKEKLGGLIAHAINGVEIAFDGRPLSPRVEVVLHPAGAAETAVAAELVLRFSGEIPGGAKTLTWKNGGAIGSYMLTLRTEGVENAERQWIEGPTRSKPFVLSEKIVPLTRKQVVATYLKLGETHIVPHGTDHILFVLGIFLLSIRLKPILWQVTAFTIAHTITLALTMYGVVSLSPRIVEPLIALSVAYVAIENIATSRLTPWRPVLVFAFGLLHGMGIRRRADGASPAARRIHPGARQLQCRHRARAAHGDRGRVLLRDDVVSRKAVVPAALRRPGLHRHRRDRAVLVRAAGEGVGPQGW